jgi:uncharacterized secreted protein with C-terminal beta-propeller domain
MSLNKKWFSIFCFVSLFLLCAIFLNGCNSGPFGGGSNVGNPRVATFESWKELESYIKNEFAESAIPSNVYGGAYKDIATATAISNFSPDISVDVSSSGYSHTNAQEAGVNESDKIMTDGQYLYVSGDNAIHIVDAVPADNMNIINTINVNGAVDSIYLYNDILIVLYNPDGDITHLDWIGQDIGFFWGMGFPYWMPVNRKTGVLIMDVSDPLSTERITEWTFDGWMVSSRLINGRLHIIQQFLPDLPQLQTTYDGNATGRDTVIAANRQAMESTTLEELIPYYQAIDAEGNVVNNAPLITPENFYRPSDSKGGSITSIISLNLNNLSGGIKSKGLIADASTVYASEKALYIAASKWNSETYDIRNDAYYRTYLYKFSIVSENVIFEGMGEAKGRILNQFSLGEYNDVLRIATSTGGWGETLNSNIYCFNDTGNDLKVAGKLEGLAPGEDIYAARFIGTRGFLVTFENTDPLFTIDLTDPSNPVVAGELEVPGYSNYIHPLGENHLITLGKDVLLDNGTAWFQGLQLSIFDITDFSSPHLLYTETIGDRGTSSEALSNHKAFTFWQTNNLLAIPVDLYEHQEEPEYPYSYGAHTFTGLYVYRISIEDGFEYLGRINTTLETSQTYSNEYWSRGLFINQDVYAVTHEAVRSANVEDIENSLSSLIFPFDE